MTLAWQDLAALLLVATACAYLTRVAWKIATHEKAGACGGCGTCGDKSSADEQPVFEIGPARSER